MTIRVWDVATQQQISLQKVPKGYKMSVSAVAFDGSRRYIASGRV
jgi:WD40 repeat protein